MMKFIQIIIPIARVILSLSPGNDVKEDLRNHQDNDRIYRITGNIIGAPDGWIYLSHTDRPKKGMRIDSTRVINQQFTFDGYVLGIEPFILGLPGKDDKGKVLLSSIVYRGPFILSAGNLHIEGSYDERTKLSAFGTKPQNEFNSFNEKLKTANGKLNRVIRELYSVKRLNSKKIDSLNNLFTLYTKQSEEIVIAHVSQYSTSLLSAYIALTAFSNTDPLVVKNVYAKLGEEVRESKYGRALLDLIKATNATAINSFAPPFSMPDPTGKEVSLSDSKGTYTLIDFWASWCAPCRIEHPNLIEVYNKYKLKGFKIISISMDKSKKSWLTAIGEDKLQWVHVSDLKGLESTTGRTYGITVLPMNFLIDNKGRIIARNLRGGELKDKLKEIFN